MPVDKSNTLVLSIRRCWLLFIAALVATACSTTTTPEPNSTDFPVEVSSIAVKGEPKVGTLVTLHFELRNNFGDSPEAGVTIFKFAGPDSVAFFAGDTYSSTAHLDTPLAGKQTKGYDVQFCVLQPGRYTLYVEAATPVGDPPSPIHHGRSVVVLTGPDSAEAYGDDADWMAAWRAHGTPTPTPVGMPLATAIPAAQCAAK